MGSFPCPSPLSRSVSIYSNELLPQVLLSKLLHSGHALFGIKLAFSGQATIGGSVRGLSSHIVELVSLIIKGTGGGI